MTFVRLDYLTPEGWLTGHAGIELLNPKGYVDRLFKRQKYGRAVVVDEDGKELGERFTPPSLPDRARLVPDPPYRVPRLPAPGEKPPACPFCDEAHPAPHDGSCLI